MKKNSVGKVLKGVVIGILAVILIINLWIIIQVKVNPDKVPSIFGYKPFIVLSGSMETEIYAGDLVFVKNADVETLKEGDIIAFKDSDGFVITHRIITVSHAEDKTCFETKGDNNNAKDENLVCADSVEGLYSSRIPKIGHFLSFIQQPLGFAVLMLSLLIICIFIYLVSNRKKNNQLSEEELKEFEEFKKSKAKKSKEKDGEEL